MKRLKILLILAFFVVWAAAGLGFAAPPFSHDSGGGATKASGPGTTLTIASGIVTVSAMGGYHKIAVETGASDDLVTINGGTTGQVLTLEAADPTKPIYLLRTGNLQGDADSALAYSTVTLLYNGSKWVLPKMGAAGAGTGDFLADGTVPMTGAIVPNAANTIALGSASAEWADLFLGDGAIIYGQNDQSNTMTSGASGWTFNKVVTAPGFQSTKSSGVAGDDSRYEANSTDTSSSGRRGADSLTYSYRGKDPGTRATSANMVEAWTNAGEAGDGGDSTPWVQTISWVDLDDYLLKDSTEDHLTSGFMTGLTKSIVLTHASGVHDGADDAAIMTDSGESFTASAMVGMTVYNVTDGSSGLVTANDGTTVTATLAGGTDNNWDTNDVWQVGPGPKQSNSAFYVSAASTIRHPATAGYIAAYYVTGAVALIIEVADAMTIVGATAAAVDAGDTIDSPATAGAFIVLHNMSATSAMAWGRNGTWVDGGAS